MNSHGGKRQGAGRKPSPKKLVNIQAKVTPELKAWLIKTAAQKGMTVSKLIAYILEDSPRPRGIFEWAPSIPRTQPG